MLTWLVCAGIGSGGTYALGTLTPATLLSPSLASSNVCPLSLYVAAARALIDQPDLDAEQIGRKAMRIAADICVYTNDNFVVEMLEDSSVTTKTEE